MSQPTPAPLSVQAAARQRLQQLETYLQADPSNAVLRLDAFETALRAGVWDAAHTHLDHGRQHQPAQALAWVLRESEFWLAQQQFEAARQVLEAATLPADAPADFLAARLHNLAYIDFRQGQFKACTDRLASQMEDPARMPPAAQPALQQLWLRALHLQGAVDQAVAWAEAAERQGQLHPQAAGVASLVALDGERLDLARHWSEEALAALTPGEEPGVEALVTQASLALQDADAPRAQQLAQAVLSRRPEEGRSWSVLGLAHLMTGAWNAALESFQHALKAMPGHIGTWHGQGWAQILNNQPKQAQASFEQALALDPNFAESHGGLGVVLAMQGDKPAAEAAIERALRLDRTSFSAAYAHAVLRGEASQPEALRRLAQRLFAARGMVPPVVF